MECEKLVTEFLKLGTAEDVKKLPIARNQL
jgi:hypothetical protein